MRNLLKALAVASTEHCERRRSGPEYRHSLDLGCGMANAASDGLGLARILGRDDDCGQTAEGRHGGFAARVRLGGIETGSIA